MKNEALLLVDLQNDFCLNGNLAVPGGEETVPVANVEIEKSKNAGNLVIATQDYHPVNHKSFASQHSGKSPGDIIDLDGISQILWPDHCVEGTSGSEFHPNLKCNFDKIIKKGGNERLDSYSGFFENDNKTSTGLSDFLKSNNVGKITVLGLATDYCVKYTVLDALKLGFDVRLKLTGCRAVNLNSGDDLAAIKEMSDNGAIIDKN